MSPSILVEDCDTKQFIKVFTKSSDLTDFLASEKANGVDIQSKYLVHGFTVEQTFFANEAIKVVNQFGYLPDFDEYEAE
jgi:hypothetical protein